MKKKLLIALVAVVLVAAAGISATNVSAQPASQTFSVAVHIAYPDGFVYDGIVARGVDASDLNAYLAECGKGHRGGSGVSFHCYAIAE
jgi:hypothetical protein